MRKPSYLFLSIIFTLITSCSKNDETNKVDESIYYDKDADCPVGGPGTCCDVDGRVLVNPNSHYTYTVKGHRDGSSNLSNIIWKVTSGAITIESGQNTTEATFKFGPDFTTGTINAGSTVNGAYCESEINISKL